MATLLEQAKAIPVARKVHHKYTTEEIDVAKAWAVGIISGQQVQTLLDARGEDGVRTGSVFLSGALAQDYAERIANGR